MHIDWRWNGNGLDMGKLQQFDPYQVHIYSPFTFITKSWLFLTPTQMRIRFVSLPPLYVCRLPVSTPLHPISSSLEQYRAYTCDLSCIRIRFNSIVIISNEIFSVFELHVMPVLNQSVAQACIRHTYSRNNRKCEQRCLGLWIIVLLNRVCCFILLLILSFHVTSQYHFHGRRRFNRCQSQWCEYIGSSGFNCYHHFLLSLSAENDIDFFRFDLPHLHKASS